MADATQSKSSHNNGLIPAKPGEIRNPKGINQHSKGKSLTQCLINAGQELHRTPDGGTMTFNEFYAAGVKRIVAEFLMDYKAIAKKDAWKYEMVMKIWSDRLSPVGTVPGAAGGDDKKSITVIISKERPIEVIDVHSSMAPDVPENAADADSAM